MCVYQTMCAGCIIIISLWSDQQDHAQNTFTLLVLSINKFVTLAYIQGG